MSPNDSWLVLILFAKVEIITPRSGVLGNHHGPEVRLEEIWPYGTPLALPSPRTPFVVRVYTRCRLRDAAQSYQQPLDNLRMVTPRAESSPSNCATPGEVSRSPGTMTAHSRFSRNSFDLICHCPKDDDFASPIWPMDHSRTRPSTAASSAHAPA